MNKAMKKPRTVALDAVLTKAEWIAMMDAAADGKDQAVMVLGVLGLRASEIGACAREWVDMAQMTIRVPSASAKRGKGRVVPYGNLAVVKDVITSFFMIERSVGLSRIAVYQRVQRMASKANLTHPVTPHGLRATGATWLAQAGWSITGLQAHFGWSCLKTAEHYINATGASAMKDMDRHGGKVI